jgi:3-hydroxyisobutyrate dehydrogenase
MSTIGFIGLGNMGYPMAGRLADAGHHLIVADRDQDLVKRFVTDHDAATPARADSRGWKDADIIITMLPNSAIVEQVLLADGTADLAALNTLFIDMSSSEPLRSRTLASTLESKGLRFLDAPVSGGVRGAQAGQLAIMVGGRWQDLDQAKELFDVLGKSVIHVGDAGTGHAAKALNNLVSAASVVATVEALRIGEAFGISPGTMTDVLNASSGRSNTSENKVQQFMLSGTFGSGFPIGLMTKDIRIATALAASLGVDSPFSGDCQQLWEATIDAGFAGEDHTRMYEILGNKTPLGSLKEEQLHA